MAFEDSDHPRRPSRELDYENAIAILLRLKKGEFQNRIAADFDVNPARVSEIKNGHRFAEAHTDPRLA